MTRTESGRPTVQGDSSRRFPGSRVGHALSSSTVWLVLLLAVSVAAGAWLFILTERGIGAGSDSAVYIAGARNLLEGRGFTWPSGDGSLRPINHYPPFYSVALSAGLAIGLSAESTARVLNVILMAANTFLVGAVAGLLAASGPVAVLGALLFAASEETLGIHSWAMSDGLYLFLSLLCVTAATWTLRHGSSRLARTLMWGSAGLAFLTRYAGIALLAVPLLVAWHERRAGRTRPNPILAWLGLALIPGSAWIVRNIVLTGSATNRRFGAYALDAHWWRNLGELIASWFLPGRMIQALETARVSSALVALALLAAIVLGLVLVRRSPGNPDFRVWVWLPLSAWIGSHILMLGLSTATSYPPPDIDTRMLGPVFAAVLALIAGVLGAAGRTSPPWARGVLVMLAVGLLIFKAYSGRDVVRRLARDGQGYTSALWSRSPTVRALRDLSPALVYANDTGAVYYFTGHPAFQVPLRYDPVTGLEADRYRTDYCLMRARLAEGGGVLVLFGLVTSVPESIEEEVLLQGLEPVMEAADGGIFRDGGGTLPGCDSAGEGESDAGVARQTQRPPEDR